MSGEGINVVFGANGNDGGARAVAYEMVVSVSGQFAVRAQGVICYSSILFLRGVPQGEIGKSSGKVLSGGVAEVAAGMVPDIGVNLGELSEGLAVVGKGSRSGRSEANFGVEALPGDELLQRSEKAVSGYVGVSKHKNRWQAQVWMNGKLQFVGSFVTAVEAARARRDWLFVRTVALPPLKRGPPD